MVVISFPTTKVTKDKIRNAIGHPCIFVIKGNATACPTCSGADNFDPVNNTSLDPWCVVCSGAYWLIEDDEVTITGHVRWRSGDEPDYGIAGEVLVGDAFVTIAIDALTESQVTSLKEIRVDSRRVVPFRTIYRGVPTRDRVRFLCREQGKE